METEEASMAGPPPQDASAGKICPRCKTRNEAYALLCVCGESLEGGSAVASEAARVSCQPEIHSQTGKTPRRLWLIVGTQTLECRHGEVLGREGTLACDLFRPIQTVSGKHVALEFRGDGWYLVNLQLQRGRTKKNVTEVDGRPLMLGEAVALSGEHIVRMSSRCEVRLRVEHLDRDLDNKPTKPS